MFKIYDGRECFWQWDLNQKIIVDNPTVTEVHFCNKTDDCSLVVEVYSIDGVFVADVPNILLQNDWTIRAYAYTGTHTLVEKRFKVNARTKPADYIYTETEVLSYEKFVEDVEKSLTEFNKEVTTLSADVKNLTNNLNNKVDKLVPEDNASLVYMEAKNSGTMGIALANKATRNTIPKRGNYGELYVRDNPTLDNEAVSKAYVDNAINGALEDEY